MPIRTSAQLLDAASDAQIELAAMFKRLDEMAAEWTDADRSALARRIAATARQSGVSESDIAEYVGSIEHAITSLIGQATRAASEVRSMHVTLGSLAHCVEALRAKAARARRGGGML